MVLSNAEDDDIFAIPMRTLPNPPSPVSRWIQNHIQKPQCFSWDLTTMVVHHHDSQIGVSSPWHSVCTSTSSSSSSNDNTKEENGNGMVALLVRISFSCILVLAASNSSSFGGIRLAPSVFSAAALSAWTLDCWIHPHRSNSFKTLHHFLSTSYCIIDQLAVLFFLFKKMNHHALSIMPLLYSSLLSVVKYC